jgi:hypothetical protein
MTTCCRIPVFIIVKIAYACMSCYQIDYLVQTQEKAETNFKFTDNNGHQSHGARTTAHGAPTANSGAHVTHQTPLHADTPKDRPRPGNNKKNRDQMRRRPAASA